MSSNERKGIFGGVMSFFGYGGNPSKNIQTRFGASRDVVPRWLYSMLTEDLDMIVVGGYALEQFNHVEDWKATDVDFVTTDEKAYNKAIDRLENGMHEHPLRRTTTPPDQSYPMPSNVERYVTYEVKGVDRKIQLILMRPRQGERSVEETYRNMSDRVGQVTFRMDRSGRRIFSVPEDCRHIALEGLVRREDTADEPRNIKYGKRLTDCGDWKYQFTTKHV